MPQMTDEIRERIAMLLTTATERYESDAGRPLRETPFIFFVGGDGEIKISPVVFQMDEIVNLSAQGYGASAGRIMEQIALQQAPRRVVQDFGPQRLVGRDIGTAEQHGAFGQVFQGFVTVAQQRHDGRQVGRRGVAPPADDKLPVP